MSEPTADGLEALQKKYIQAQADNENLRKRIDKVVAETAERTRRETLLELLPIVDDLQRVNAAAASEAGMRDPQAMQEAVFAVARKALATLSMMEVQTFDSVGQTFKAELMDAIAKVSTKALPPGQVAVEISPGYTLKGKLLRPAQVAVAEDE